MKKILSCFVVLILVLSACTSVKNMSLMKNMSAQTAMPSFPEFIVEAGDELSVYVTALDPQAVAPFNTGMPYQVQQDGTIDMPILGTVQVAGKTENEVKDMVSALVSDNVQNPFVSVRISGAAISVLGQVNAPQKMGITKPVTVLDAIGAAGGLSRNARYDRVEVIRGQGNKMTKYIVDLTSPELPLSPCYYLTKGDVVNVLPLRSVLTK